MPSIKICNGILDVKDFIIYKINLQGEEGIAQW